MGKPVRKPRRMREGLRPKLTMVGFDVFNHAPHHPVTPCERLGGLSLGAIHSSQFSTFNPFTRRNSLRLRDTSTRLRAHACPAISTS